MKNSYCFLLVVLCFACQDQKETGYSISGTAPDIEDGTVLYVNAISESNRPTVLDSTVVKNEKFSLDLPETETLDFHYITFKNIAGNVVYLPENNPIEMTIYRDSLRSSIVKGGSENDLFFTYLNKVNTLGKKKMDYQNQYQIASKLKEKEKLVSLQQDQLQLIEEEKEFRKELAQKYPNSIVSVMALSDMMNLKYIPAKEAKGLYDTFKDTLKTTRLGKNLDRLITSSIGKIDIGSEAANFTAPTPDGNNLSLDQAMGKITIIDFWASWCKPCRIENPNVVRIYNKYHDKGLNIIGVSLDKKKEQWVQAIQQDNLEWQHVSNLKFWQDPVAQLYGVRSIPATFILDENGNVIARNLRGPALESKIAELLGEVL